MWFSTVSKQHTCDDCYAPKADNAETPELEKLFWAARTRKPKLPQPGPLLMVADLLYTCGNACDLRRPIVGPIKILP